MLKNKIILREFVDEFCKFNKDFKTQHNIVLFKMLFIIHILRANGLYILKISFNILYLTLSYAFGRKAKLVHCPLSIYRGTSTPLALKKS